MSLVNEIEKVKTYTQDAYNKLEEKGATLPEQKNLQNLSSTIDSISGGGDYECTWKPDPNWWDIEKILEEDTEDYPAKAICLIDDTGISCSGANMYKTNEMSEPKSSIDDFTGVDDKQSSYNYKTRWIIFYFNSTTTSNVVFPNNSLYIIVDGLTTNKSGLFQNFTKLEAIKYKNGAKTNGSVEKFCNGCTALRLVSLPEGFTTTSINYMLGECHSLEYLEINLTKFTDDIYTASHIKPLLHCHNLKHLKIIINSNSTRAPYLVNDLSLIYPSIIFETNEIISGFTGSDLKFNMKKLYFNPNKNYDFTFDVFQKRSSNYDENDFPIYNIETIKNISDTYKVTIKQLSSYIYCLKGLYGNIELIGKTDIHEANNFETFDNLIEMLSTTKTNTITFGTNLLQKLTEEQKDRIIEKGWTYA